MSETSVGQIGLDLVVNQNSFKKQMLSINSLAKKAGAALASAFAVKKLVDYGNACLDLGSDLQEVQNVVDVTFPEMTAQVDDFAKSAVSGFGLSETMAKQFTGTFGAMAKAFGFTEKQAYDMGSTLTGLAGDVASFYNITQDEAYTKLKSVFTGETESLKDLGIVMTQSALDAYALANGFSKTTKEMSEAEKVALRYQFVQNQLNAAAGDFSRTSDSWANQVRVLDLRFDSLKATIGQGLIAAFTPVIRMINIALERLQVFATAFKDLIESIFGKQQSSENKALSDAAQAAGSIESSTDAVANNLKKASKSLAGFDELHVIKDTSLDSGVSNFDLGGVGNIISATKENAEKTGGLIDQIKNKFSDFIEFSKRCVENVKGIFSDLYIGDVFLAGQKASVLAEDIFNFLADATEKVKWNKIGEKIGGFIAGIDWQEISKSAFKLSFNIWESIADIWFGAYDAAPIETSVITAIAALKWTGLGDAIVAGMVASLKSSIKKVGITVGTSFMTMIPQIASLLTQAFTILSPGMIGELGLSLERLLEGTFLDASTWTGIPKMMNDLLWGITYATGDVIEDVVVYLGKSIAEAGKKLFNFDDAGAWFSDSSEWFSKVKEDFASHNWLGIGEDIVFGIGNGIVGALTGLVEPFTDLFKWTYEGICKVFGINSPATQMIPIGENILLGIVEGFSNKISEFQKAIAKWWNESVKPWFTKEKWAGLYDNVKIALVDKWKDITAWWDEFALTKWWKNSVEPWFAKDKWVKSMSGIKEGFKESFKNACNAAINVFNQFIDWINNNMHFSWDAITVAGMQIVPAGDVQLFSVPHIPMLASGGYVKANTPQLTIIGDNKRYGEIVAPEDKMYQISFQAMLDAMKQFMQMTPMQQGSGDINLVIKGELAPLFRFFKIELEKEGVRIGKNFEVAVQ